MNWIPSANYKGDVLVELQSELKEIKNLELIKSFHKSFNAIVFF